MSLLCLSLAATLRCAGFSETESIVLLAPPAVEAVVSLFLIRTVWRNGRKRWLLVAEAWAFLTLAILDSVSHLIVRNTSSLVVFEPMDKAIGALSFGPILLYISFLFLLTRADLLPLITPASLRTTLQFTIFSFIPPVIMTNELGSLLGVSYRINQSSVGPVPEIGFFNSTSKSLSVAFTQTTVVLLGTFQVLIFLLCTWRISQAWHEDSQPVFIPAARTRRDSINSDSYLGEERGIRGLSWLALALVLGAAETFLSLGPQRFPFILTRRILRVFARGFLLYSLVRGSSDGFSNLEEGQSEAGVRALISNPRLSTFAHLTPTATAFYNTQRGGARPANANPFAEPAAVARNLSPESRVTVSYDLKSAPVLQMRFSGLVVPDSSNFAARSMRSSSTVTQPTSMAAHGGHSTQTVPTLERSRTLSEKRSGPPLASIQIPDTVVLAGVVATQSASSSRSSLPPIPPLPPQPVPQTSRPTPGSANRSSSMSTATNGESLEAVRELASQFPGLPSRVSARRGPTQLAYAVEEEEEPPSSQQHPRTRSTSRSQERAGTADSNLSPLSSTSRRKPVPAHTPSGTIIDLPSTNPDQSRLRGLQSRSGEQVVVETHGALFPDEEQYPRSTRSSTRSSSLSSLTSTASPAEILIGRPGRLAARVAQLERQQRLSGGDEHNWMRGSRELTVPIPVPMSQSAVVSRTPEVQMSDTDYESSRVELGDVASPKSAWSAQVPWSSSSTPAPRPAVGLPANPRVNKPGSNVEGWGRKMSESDPSRSQPTLQSLAAEEEARSRAGDDSRWKESEVLGRYEGAFVRRSLASSRRGSFASDPPAGDEPHAL